MLNLDISCQLLLLVIFFLFYIYKCYYFLYRPVSQSQTNNSNRFYRFRINLNSSFTLRQNWPIGYQFGERSATRFRVASHFKRVLIGLAHRFFMQICFRVFPARVLAGMFILILINLFKLKFSILKFKGFKELTILSQIMSL